MAEPILLFKPIVGSVAEDITRKLIESKDEVVNLWMNTPGGVLNDGWSILAAMHEMSKKVDMTVLGDADSFGVFMLLYGRRNKAYDTSTFIIHRAGSAKENQMSTDELKMIKSRNDIIRQKMEARLNEDKFKQVTSYSFDDIFSMDNRLDVNIDAKQAKEIGLIDEIVVLDSRRKKELEEIESRYIKDIAALAEPKKVNSNININKMGKLKDLIFGEKDPILTASIDDRQFVYGKLEEGASIKAIGQGEQEPITGTFEANDKQVTVVENKITAVKEVDTKSKLIEALNAKIEKLEANQLTAEEVAEVIKESNQKQAEKIEAVEKENAELRAILEKARLTASKPELPEGEFKDTPLKDKRTLEEKLSALQKEKYESKRKGE